MSCINETVGDPVADSNHAVKMFSSTDALRPLGEPVQPGGVRVGVRDLFLKEKQANWDALTTLAKKAKGRAEKLAAPELLQLGALYRSASADLAYARRQFPGDPMLEELERKIYPARAVIYERPRNGVTLRSFYRDRYWRLVRERSGLLSVAIAMMVVPALLVFVWTLRDPDRAASLLGERFSGGRTSWADQGYSTAEQSAIATSIFLNNIRVSFLAYASGVLFGFGTAYLLVFNGALLGLVAGLSTTDGHGGVAFTLIVGHGILELSVIAVTAMAGLRMGMALAKPGLEPRRIVLQREAKSGVEIVVGTIPFFILAGLIEGYFTPSGFGPVWAGTVGVVVGGAYWLMVIRRGRARLST